MSTEEEKLSKDEATEETRVKEVAEDIEALKKLLDEEKTKAERYLANWQRAQADFINYKKRMEQEKNELTTFANSVLILNLLPIVDDFDRALASVSPKLLGLTWTDGIRLIYRKLQALLEARGVSGIKAQGEPFDPRFHEAVMYNDGEEGMVIEEIQKGYKLKEYVLRPSLVVVGKGKQKEEIISEEKPEATSQT